MKNYNNSNSLNHKIQIIIKKLKIIISLLMIF